MRQSPPVLSNAIVLLVSSVISARAAGTFDGSWQFRPKGAVTTWHRSVFDGKLRQ